MIYGESIERTKTAAEILAKTEAGNIQWRVTYFTEHVFDWEVRFTAVYNGMDMELVRKHERTTGGWIGEDTANLTGVISGKKFVDLGYLKQSDHIETLGQWGDPTLLSLAAMVIEKLRKKHHWHWFIS